MQAAVGCRGAEVLKPSCGCVVNIIRKYAIAIFKARAAAEFVVVDVVNVVLGGGFVALHAYELPAIVIVVFHQFPIGIQNGVNAVPAVVLPAGSKRK